MKIIVSVVFLFFVIDLNAQITFQKSISFPSVYGQAEIKRASQTFDGGYVFTGLFQDTAGVPGTAFLIKTDSMATIQWSKRYDNPVLGLSFNSIRSTSDGGYIMISGEYVSDIIVVKTNSNGDTSWTRRFGGMNTDNGNEIIQTSDGGYILGGTTWSYGSGGADMLLIKTDSLGIVQWSKTYGTYQLGWAPNNDYLHSLSRTFDGGYILGGMRALHSNSTQRGYLLKTDSSGNITSDKMYADNFFGYHDFKSMYQTADSGYVLFDIAAGSTKIIKVDNQGLVSWSRWITSAGYSVIETVDSSFTIAGGNSLIKFGLTGDTLWIRNYGPFGPGEYLNINSQVQCNDGGFLLSGWVYNFSGNGRPYVIKTDSSGNSQCMVVPNTVLTDTFSMNSEDTITIVSVINPVSYNAGISFANAAVVSQDCFETIISYIENTPLCTFNPNPFNSYSRLEVEKNQSQFIRNNCLINIYNMLGTLVRRENIHDLDSYILHRGSLPNGMYFFELKNENSEHLAGGKFILQ